MKVLAAVFALGLLGSPCLQASTDYFLDLDGNKYCRAEARKNCVTFADGYMTDQAQGTSEHSLYRVLDNDIQLERNGDWITLYKLRKNSIVASKGGGTLVLQ